MFFFRIFSVLFIFLLVAINFSYKIECGTISFRTLFTTVLWRDMALKNHIRMDFTSLFHVEQHTWLYKSKRIKKNTFRKKLPKIAFALRADTIRLVNHKSSWQPIERWQIEITDNILRVFFIYAHKVHRRLSMRWCIQYIFFYWWVCKLRFIY